VRTLGVTAGKGASATPAIETLAALVVIGALTFNALLALVNAQLMPVSRTHVIMAEIALLCAAIGLIALRFSREMMPWIALLLLILFFHAALSAVTLSFNPKHVRDAALIPIFIMLGMASARMNLVRLVVFIQMLILSVLIYEGLEPHSFGQTFNIIGYYISTRDFAVADFWNTELGLFISATRPSERVTLAFTGLHRMSSIFLEPVSLGNYCIVVTAITIALWKRMTLLQKLFLSLTTLIILLGSDGRLAIATSAVLLFGAWMFPRLPTYSNVLYLPGLLVAAWFAVWLLGLQWHQDTFSGRLALSMGQLGRLNIPALLGLDPHFLVGADSGVSYLVLTQSLIGAIFLWLFISLGITQQTRAGVVFAHAVCISIAFSLLVSYSIFSIKSAALLWFAYGHIHGNGLRRADVARTKQLRTIRDFRAVKPAF